MTINKNVDLGKSFEKLKASLIEITENVNRNNNKERYAYGFGRLETAIKTHLLTCTDLTGEELYKELDNPDDLKEVNI